MSSATEARHHAGSRLAWVLLCLTTLAAVFAMHGPTIDHMLAMPGPAGNLAMTSTPTTAGTAGITSSAMTPSVTRGHSVQSANRRDPHSVSVEARTAVLAVAGGYAMSHGNCLATLRDANTAAPAVVGTPPGLHGAAPATSSSDSSSQRAPPAPTLTRMCISRT